MKTKQYIKGSIHKEVLGVVGILFIIELILGVFFTDAFGAAMSKMIYLVGEALAGGLTFCAVLAVILGICYIIFRYGDIRIGGEDESRNILSMVVFARLVGHRMRPSILAMGEPIYHYMHPPVADGIESRSREAAVFAVGQTMFDWSFVQYFIYAIPAVLRLLYTVGRFRLVDPRRRGNGEG